MEIISPFLPQIHGCRSRPVLHRGKLSRIAVGQQAVPGLYQLQGILSDLPADFNVLIVDADGFFLQKRPDLRHTFCQMRPNHVFHPVQRPEQVDRRRAGGCEILFSLLKFPVKDLGILRMDLLCRKVDSGRGRHADGGSPSDLQKADRLPDILDIRQRQHLDLSRKLRLVYDHQRVMLQIQRDCLVIQNTFFSFFHSYNLFSYILFRFGYPPGCRICPADSY